MKKIYEKAVVRVFESMPFDETQNVLVDDDPATGVDFGDWIEAKPAIFEGAYSALKIADEMTLKVSTGSFLDASPEGAKYVSISAWDKESRTERSFYFFVRSVDYLSVANVSLSLSLDVLNSAARFSSSPDSWFSPRTKVVREHRDRFRMEEKTGSFVPVIDLVPEGLAFPLKRVSKRFLEDDGPDWTLFYATAGETDANAPIYPLLVPEEPIPVKKREFLNESFDFEESFKGKSIFHLFADSPGDFTLSANVPIAISATRKYEGQRLLIIGAGRIYYRDDGGSEIFALWYDENGAFAKEEKMGESPRVVGFTGSSGVRALDYSKYPEGKSLQFIASLPFLRAGVTTRDADKELGPSSKVNRSSLSLRRAFELPYRPFDADPSSMRRLPDDWIVWEGKLILPETSFSRNVSFDFSVLEKRKLALPKPSPIGSEDPKLFSSEFFFPKLVYDSFSMAIPIEETYFCSNLDLNGVSSFSLEIVYSASFGNEFAVHLRSYPTNNLKDHNRFPTFAREDYARVFVSSRSLETPIFDNRYLEYLQSGYEFDKKSRSVSILNDIVSVAISGANLGVSAISAFATGGLTAPWAVGAATSFAGSVYSALRSASESERSLAQRLKETNAQGASVAGCSDFGVSKSYTQNKIAFEIYSVDGNARKALEALFFYEGYASVGAYVPNVTTRRNFNYLKCEADFAKEAKERIPSEWIGKLKAKFAEGVVYSHGAEGFLAETNEERILNR